MTVYFYFPTAADTRPALIVDADCNPDSELKCADGSSCYFKSERCDRNIHCLDNSDEDGCSCRDYLPAHRLCDGFNDCPDGQDEDDCKCSVSGTFFCGLDDRIPICINEQLRSEKYTVGRKHLLSPELLVEVALTFNH